MGAGGREREETHNSRWKSLGNVLILGLGRGSQVFIMLLNFILNIWLHISFVCIKKKILKRF